jgi:hypothetical protein
MSKLMITAQSVFDSAGVITDRELLRLYGAQIYFEPEIGRLSVAPYGGHLADCAVPAARLLIADQLINFLDPATIQFSEIKSMRLMVGDLNKPRMEVPFDEGFIARLQIMDTTLETIQKSLQMYVFDRTQTIVVTPPQTKMAMGFTATRDETTEPVASTRIGFMTFASDEQQAENSQMAHSGGLTPQQQERISRLANEIGRYIGEHVLLAVMPPEKPTGPGAKLPTVNPHAKPA